MTTVEQKFAECWEAEVADRRKRSPSYKPSEYTATGRAAKEYGGKRNTQWWLDNGPAMVQDWIDWREATGWEIPEIGGKPGVEIELSFSIPGVDLPIKGYIDRVFAIPATRELAIVDLKTGRSPETAEQLGLYRVGLGMVYDIWPRWGYFWSPGKGHGAPINLEEWTPKRFAVMFNNSINAINAGSFNPNPANSCRNWCGVARYCAVVGGPDAAGVDSLAV